MILNTNSEINSKKKNAYKFDFWILSILTQSLLKDYYSLLYFILFGYCFDEKICTDIVHIGH